MKCSIAVLLVCSLGRATCTQIKARDVDDHPVASTIKLLQSMMGKVEQQRASEEITFTKYKYWCSNSLKTLSGSIAEEKANIDSLNSEIESLEGQEAQLNQQIDELGKELLELAAAGAKSQRIRKSTAGLYSEADADYESTIKAIADALKALQDAYASTEPSLVQSAEKTMSQATKAKVLQALTLGSSLASASDAQRTEIADLVEVLSTPEPPAPPAPPAPERPDLAAEGDYGKHIDTYDFKSHKVIELLKGLQQKFEENQEQAEKEETNSLNAFALEKQARDEMILQAGNSKTTKETDLGDVQGDLSDAKGKLLNEKSDIEADLALQSSTQKACDIKTQEYGTRQQVRAGEVEAMQMAIKILSDVTGVRSEAPSNPVPPPSPVLDATGAALLEVATDPKSRAVQLLRESARQTHSKALEKLAKEIAAHKAGPFDTVTNEIEKLIFRLMQEQKDEDVHKNWCDLELNKTDTSIAAKADKMTELAAKIRQAVARAAELTTEIKEDNEMVATISGHMSQSEDIRGAGKEENNLAVKDAKQAQVAIANAISVLEAFYKSTGKVATEAWEFVQQPTALSDEPSTWDKSYTGISDPTLQPRGIISVLKSIATKFSEMEADTNAQEETDQHFYEQDMKNSKIEIARRTKEAEMKAEEKKRLADKTLSLEEQHKHVSDQKEATDQYLKDLQHACVDADSTYEERVAARSNEIAALKQAQVILRDAFKQKSSFLQLRVKA